jgi:hypothetical protein
MESLLIFSLPQRFDNKIGKMVIMDDIFSYILGEEEKT